MHRLQPPETVLEIADQLEKAGFEAWCVGGAIRDALLGHPHLDWDLATSATPSEMRELFGARRTIPVGIDFGTVGVLDRDGRMHEVTTFRQDVRTDGRHAEVEFGVSLDDDLARRDYTINAIAYSPQRKEVRDPFDGQRDLENRIVRAVGDPVARMREDRLRALRGIRFAARFGFAIDDATLRAIAESGPYLGRLSMERVKQELDKTLEQVRCPSFAFSLWQSTGAFAALQPELTMVPPASFLVVDQLALPGVAIRPARRVLRFAALLATLTPAEATAVLTKLRASRHEIQTVAALIGSLATHGEPMANALVASDPPDDAQIRKWVAGIGRLRLGAFMRLANAIWRVRAAEGLPAPAPAATHSAYRRMWRSALRDPIDLGSLAVDGDDLRRAGIPAGPALGKILQALLAAVLEDPTRNTADWLLQEAERQSGKSG